MGNKYNICTVLLITKPKKSPVSPPMINVKQRMVREIFFYSNCSVTKKSLGNITVGHSIVMHALFSTVS
jgi:hypothetical protein